MVSNRFIEECRNPAYKNRLGKVQVGDEITYLTVTTDLKVSNNLKISSKASNVDNQNGYLAEISINDSCYSNGSIIGTTISKTSTIKVLDTRDLMNKDFIAFVGIKYNDSTTEYLNIGKYTTTEQTIDKTNKNSEIKGQDKLLKLDEPYVCNIEDWTNKTVKDVLEDLCESIDVELGTEHFINEDIPVDGNKYQKNYKNRDVLSDICELACTWAELGEDNKLYLNWFSDEVVDTLDKSQYQTLERNNTFGYVNCLVIKSSAFEGENNVIQDTESIEEIGENQVCIIDNNFLDTEELRILAINNIWNRIKGFQYVDCKIITPLGKPHLKRGSKIRVQDDDGSYFETYVLNHDFKYDGTFYSEISSPCLNKEQTIIKNTNLTPKQRIMNAEAQVLKNEATIRLMVEEQTQFQSEIEENYYTKTTVNELIEDTKEGLTNKYTVGGGNNILRNTGLYFETSTTKYSSGYEFWEGTVKRVTNTNSKTRTSMYLQNGTLHQRQEIPNDIYTVSFQYKQLNSLANASVIINDVEYELGASGTFTQNIDVRTNAIVITFNCDTNDGYEVYELMCNYGEVALQYTQNANETKTDTVQISEGITITSDDTDSTFKANADGIRIENRYGNKTTEFLDSGTKTTYIEAGKGNIANLLIEEVDGQVWIAGLGR